MIVGSSPTVVCLFSLFSGHGPFIQALGSGFFFPQSGRNRATTQHMLCLCTLVVGALEYGSRGYLTQLLHACMHDTWCMYALSVPIHHMFFFSVFFNMIFRIYDTILCLDSFPNFCLWVFRSHKCSQIPKNALMANIHTHFAILSHLHGGLAWIVNFL